MENYMFRRFCFIAPKDMKLFGFPICRLWAYMKNVIPEMFDIYVFNHLEIFDVGMSTVS